MTDLIITNAVVVAADGANTTFEKGGVAVSNGKITHIALAETLAAMEGHAKRVIDASGMLLMPGLINTHCHAADSLFRGLVEDLKLEPWLQTVWKAEAAILNPQTTHLGSRALPACPICSRPGSTWRWAPMARFRAMTSTCGWRCGWRRRCTRRWRVTLKW